VRGCTQRRRANERRKRRESIGRRGGLDATQGIAGRRGGRNCFGLGAGLNALYRRRLSQWCWWRTWWWWWWFVQRCVVCV
jgi:hypothetical protein